MFARLCYQLHIGLPKYSPVHFLSSVKFSSRFTVCTRRILSTPTINERQVLFACQRCASSSTNKENLGVEVYEGPLSKRIRSVKLFSFATSFGGLMIQPLMVQKILEEGANIGGIIFSGAIIQFFTFGTPLLLHLITKKYVRTVYYNSDTDTYTALTYNFWTADKLLRFKTDDVVVPDIPGMLTSIVVKGTPLFLEANFFSDLDHYKRIMGYDKPIDFKLYKEEKPGTGSKS